MALLNLSGKIVMLRVNEVGDSFGKPPDNFVVEVVVQLDSHAAGAASGFQLRADANQPHLKTLPPSVAVWLATVAHVRHAHTEYERLLSEGYDRDSARFFVIDEINAVLTRWRATRLLDPDDDDI